MASAFEPPFTPGTQAAQQIRERGFAVLRPEDFAQLAGGTPADLDRTVAAWANLPLDEYLRDGGRYRKRRHSCYRVEAGAVHPVPHRAHWQSEDYNALHGGMERWFEPLDPALANASAFRRLLLGLGTLFDGLRPGPAWYVEAHSFRIETTDGIGRPTPEGAHRDGVDFVAVALVQRTAIKGGETRVFDARSPAGQRFTLTAPWSALLLDDSRVVHETTPIQPTDEGGHRDTLVLTYRRGDFQSPPSDAS